MKFADKPLSPPPTPATPDPGPSGRGQESTLPPTPPETLRQCQICKKSYDTTEELAPHSLVCKPSSSSEDEEDGDASDPYIPPEEDEEKLARQQEERVDTSEVETEEE